MSSDVSGSKWSLLLQVARSLLSGQPPRRDHVGTKGHPPPPGAGPCLSSHTGALVCLKNDEHEALLYKNTFLSSETLSKIQMINHL